MVNKQSLKFFKKMEGNGKGKVVRVKREDQREKLESQV